MSNVIDISAATRGLAPHIQAAVVDVDKQLVKAIQEGYERGIPVGMIVGLLLMHAHQATAGAVGGAA